MTADSGVRISLVQLVIYFLVYVFFILSAFRKRKNCFSKRQWMLILAYVMFSIVVIILFILRNSPFPQYWYIALTIWIGITVGMCMLILRSNLLQFLFMILVILDIQSNIIQMGAMISRIDFLPHFFKSVQTQHLFIDMMVLILYLPLLWYLFIGLYRKVIESKIDKGYWKYLFVIPLTAYVYGILSAMAYSVDNKSDPKTALFILFLLSTFSFLSYVVVLQMLIKTSDSLQAMETTAITGRQLLLQNEQYQKLKDGISQTERTRHDMRHHFVTLKGYCESKDYEAAENYIDSCMEQEFSIDENTICEKNSVDIILRHYVAKAAEAGIETKVSVQLPKEFKMSDTDLCVIFGNLMENALESCNRQEEGRKFIHIKAKLIHADMLTFMITNSYSGDILQQNEAFLSTKHEGYGVGTSSVKSIVERNGGSCKFSFNNQVFKVLVLLIS